MRKVFFLFCAAAFAGTPAVAQTAPLGPVEETAFARDAFATGLLDRDAGALPGDLWRGASAEKLSALLAGAPLRPSSPSVGVALRRVLLSAGETPAGADAALGGAKLRTLVRLGFIDEAREIESLAVGGKTDAAVLEALATADIYSGDQAAACAKVQRIAAPRDTAFGVRLRAFCYVAAGELDAGDLALGLLRERGGLSETDEAILGPLVAGGKPKAGAAAIDAVHYAAQKFSGAPVVLSPFAEAGVLRAVASDAGAAWPARLAAATRAAAMGVMSAAALKDLFGGAALDVAAVAGGADAFRQRAGDSMALAAVFQLVRSKSAPEFARDRAGVVAGVIAGARDFETLFTAAALFADDTRAFDGLLLSGPEAESLALARLALGDVAGAERWLAANGAGAGAPSDIAGLVAAAKSGTQPAAPNAGAGPAADLSVVVDAAIEAAAERIAGQGALAALAASGAAAAGDRVAEVVVARGLSTAGLGDLARRRGVERLLQDRYRRLQPAPAAATPATATASPSGDPRKPAPRVKPAPSR